MLSFCRTVKALKILKAIGRKLTWRNGIMPSLAIACSSLGAPVRLWRPAPHVEKKEPITMTHGEGHAKVPMTRFPLTPSPNLVGEDDMQCYTRKKN